MYNRRCLSLTVHLIQNCQYTEGKMKCQQSWPRCKGVVVMLGKGEAGSGCRFADWGNRGCKSEVVKRYQGSGGACEMVRSSVRFQFWISKMVAAWRRCTPTGFPLYPLALHDISFIFFHVGLMRCNEMHLIHRRGCIGKVRCTIHLMHLRCKS